jgi:hypothetical protein
VISAEPVYGAGTTLDNRAQKSRKCRYSRHFSRGLSAWLRRCGAPTPRASPSRGAAKISARDARDALRKMVARNLLDGRAFRNLPIAPARHRGAFSTPVGRVANRRAPPSD